MPDLKPVVAVIRDVAFLGTKITFCFYKNRHAGFLSVHGLLASCSDSYVDQLGSPLKEAYDICHSLEINELLKRFSKKPISAENFFKDDNKQVINNVVMPFVWKQTAKLVQLIKNNGIAVYDGRETWPNLYEGFNLTIPETPAVVNLVFSRTADGTNYTLNVLHDERILDLRADGTAILTVEPCFLLHKNKILHFDDYVNGNLLKPFLQKSFIHIPKHIEHKYFNSFIKKNVSKLDITAEGFDIIDLELEPLAVLSIEMNWQGIFGFILYFDYGDRRILSNSKQFSYTSLETEKEDNKFVFKRFRRDVAYEKHMAGVLYETGLKQQGAFYYNDKSDNKKPLFMKFVNEHFAFFEKHGFAIEQPGKDNYLVAMPEMVLRNYGYTDWFDLRIIIRIKNIEIPFIALKDHILSGEQLYILPSGERFLIPDEWFERYKGLFLHGRTERDHLRIERRHFRLLDDFHVPEARKLEKELLTNTAIEKPRLMNVNPRPYQLIGFAWMRKLCRQMMGGILADDMGLGKTLQIIALLSSYFNEKPEPTERHKQLKPTVKPAGFQLSLFDDDTETGTSAEVTDTSAEVTDTSNKGIDALNSGSGALNSGSDALNNGLDALNNGSGAINSGSDALNSGSDALNKGSGAPILITDTLKDDSDTSKNVACKSEIDSRLNRGQGKRSHKKPALLVVPTSILHNWIGELNRYTPWLKAFEYVGQGRSLTRQVLENCQVILTTYGTMRADIDILKTISFTFAILDESHLIKNPHSKTARAAFALQADHRFTLTGTPVENGLADIWSQMHFVNRGLLGSLTRFQQNYASPVEKDPEATEGKQLLILLRPFIMRRTKDQVAPEMPPLTENTILCSMTQSQLELYEREKSRFRNFLLTANPKHKSRYSKKNILLLKALMKLRQIANHPRMADESHDADSGKFDVVTSKLETLVAENHKVLIFSSFVKHLEIIEAWCKKQGIAYAKLIGSTVSRKEVINAFKEKNIPLFLISLKAGGVGLNLPEAGYVFLLDPWWNPAAEMQAINRTHRIGQDKNVIVYRFISKNTVEEKIIKLQEKKRTVAETVIKAGEFVKSLNSEDLEFLLE